MQFAHNPQDMCKICAKYAQFAHNPQDMCTIGAVRAHNKTIK